jgi:uncharacterized protein (DUF488 family)
MVSKSIYTIGHSTRSIEEFVHLLKSYEIECLVDVRTIPKSRFNPQYNAQALADALKKEGIDYIHLEKLGGLRHTTKGSVNTGWRNLSFRGFADYMQTPSFLKGIEELESSGLKYRCAIMCGEAVPWRCHRSLIADVLTIRKWQVLHITSAKSAKPHTLTSFLKLKKGQVFYPGV